MKYSKEETENARKALLELLPSGATVYTVLRSVSRSGMFRRIDLYTIDNSPRMLSINNGAPRLAYLSGYAAVILGIPRAPNGKQGLGVTGCGMDMGFHLVDNLRAALFGYDKTENGYRAKGELRQEWI
jgi:hypothetical protein